MSDGVVVGGGVVSTEVSGGVVASGSIPVVVSADGSIVVSGAGSDDASILGSSIGVGSRVCCGEGSCIPPDAGSSVGICVRPDVSGACGAAQDISSTASNSVAMVQTLAFFIKHPPRRNIVHMNVLSLRTGVELLPLFIVLLGVSSNHPFLIIWAADCRSHRYSHLGHCY